MSGGENLPMLDSAFQLPQVTRPLLLVVDDEIHLARAIELDLRREFRPQFEAICVDSAAAALDLIERMRKEDRRLALVLSDHEGDREPTPGLQPDAWQAMSGIELIAKARELYRDVKTILMIRYPEVEQALEAINAGTLDYFVIKPLGPLEEGLFPIVSDLLADWTRTIGEGAHAVRIVGHRQSEDGHRLRDFLKRNAIYFQFLDIEADSEASLLAGGTPIDTERLPLVVLGDGTQLERPSVKELAERLGLAIKAKKKFYDLVIVGGGPAGLAAAVYGASEGVSTALIEREAPGGQAGQSSKIENYLGFPSGVSGGDLAQRALIQSRRFGAEIVRLNDAIALETRGPGRVVRLADGSELSANTVLIACGVSYRRLDAPGIEELTGRGVYYGAATTEAQDSAGKEVFVVGGANSAGQAALHFADYASKVTILCRRDSLGAAMSSYLEQRIVANPKIEVRTQAQVAGVEGEGRLEAVSVMDGGRGRTEVLPAHGLFVFIGAVPRTDWLEGSVRRDERGFILSGREVARERCPEWPLERDPFLLETSMPGVFAVGDCRRGSTKRVASAVGEGAMAIQLVHEYMTELSDRGMRQRLPRPREVGPPAAGT
jgi:thioredoxin reductase (NADPH)